ncbi:hypothetical protein EDD92_9201 [Streptomyces sp. TLI_185]|nr:hypothetical protein EDD92_9201 [Streptomyces sp. TLI_185]
MFGHMENGVVDGDAEDAGVQPLAVAEADGIPHLVGVGPPERCADTTRQD